MRACEHAVAVFPVYIISIVNCDCQSILNQTRVSHNW